ncbi:MAG: UDP-glucose/GDP-mannose dehydrogenase family protein, partial [Deltaproteobacteria bacterium]|nr:UDP-glucose/GDP-mannose dehydrogenase family protein [Deltaproteobacteria bacterium]
EAVKECEIIFLAVGTPPLASGEPDLSYLKAASEEIGNAMNGYKLIVNKSTVPIGSHQVVAEWISAHTKHYFDVISNPEFLKEGSAVEDFLKPDRVIIGTHKKEIFEKMVELYAPFVRQGNPILWMDPISAEITKYACNSFLATRISFMNELALLCEKTGGDIEEIRRGMSTDVRIGRHFLYAGAGYGGSCFPKDIQAMLTTAKRNDINLEIVAAAESVNAKQKKHLVKHIKNHFGSIGSGGSRLEGKTFALWGLAFKPNTDDMREAPSLSIINALLEEKAKIRAFDPVAIANTQNIIGNKITYCNTNYETLEGADALIVVTEWNEFKHPDFNRIKTTLKTPVIFDGRNLYNPKELRDKGFTYYGIGRKS